MKKIRRRARRYDIPSPYNSQYARAICQARYRKEEWAFTPQTWLRQWQNSGVLKHRHGKVFGYVMCRVDPTEAWGPHNCVIVTRRQQLNSILSRSPRNKNKKGKPVTFEMDVTPKHMINRSFT
tara:strand:- start:149 stop:517 length:369 start_codon:yes stop_codon:yes gene_type:complete